MMECGWIICLMDKGEWYIKMEMFIKECGLWEKGAVMV